MKNNYRKPACLRWLMLLIGAMSLAYTTQAQILSPPQIQWQRVIGESTIRAKVVKASNGGYAFSTTGQIHRLSAAGGVLWSATITGTPLASSPGQYAQLYTTLGLLAMPDGGFVMIVVDAGQNSLVKFDASGNLSWRKYIVGTNVGISNPRAISLSDLVSTDDGGYLAFGSAGPGSQKGVVAIKLDQDGNITWQKEYYYETDIRLYSGRVIQSTDGGYILTGGVGGDISGQGSNGWASKIDSQGNRLWQRRYNESLFFNDVVQSPFANDTYAAIGTKTSDSGVTQVLTISADGNVLGSFSQSGRAASTSSTLASVPATNSTPAFLTIADISSQNNGDIRLLSINALSGVLWSKTLGGTGSDGVQSIMATDDNGYIIAGSTTSTDGDVKGKTTNEAAGWVVKLSSPVSAPISTLQLIQPTYNCATGVIAFNTTGGDGSPITYSAPGISRSSTASNTGVIEQELRNDPKPIMIQAFQSGNAVSYTFDFGAFCNSNNPQPPTQSTLSLIQPTYDCATGAITFNTSGGSGSVIEFRAIGITDWTTNPNQFVDKDSRTVDDVQPFTLMARQNGQVVTYTWNLKAACGRARVGLPETGTGLLVQLLGNPVQEQVRVQIRGAEGQAVQLRLMDTQGRLLENRTIKQAEAVEEQHFRLDQSGPSVLLLQAVTQHQAQTLKVIRQ